jgi:hypothetical protein
MTRKKNAGLPANFFRSGVSRLTQKSFLQIARHDLEIGPVENARMQHRLAGGLRPRQARDNDEAGHGSHAQISTGNHPGISAGKRTEVKRAVAEKLCANAGGRRHPQLLDNAKVARHLQASPADIYAEFEKIAAPEARLKVA